MTRLPLIAATLGLALAAPAQAQMNGQEMMIDDARAAFDSTIAFCQTAAEPDCIARVRQLDWVRYIFPAEILGKQENGATTTARIAIDAPVVISDDNVIELPSNYLRGKDVGSTITLRVEARRAYLERDPSGRPVINLLGGLRVEDQSY